MADLMMRKRPAMHAGEIGLFVDSQVFEDDFATIKQGTDISVQATQDINPKQFRLFWALMGKIAKSGVLGDVDSREVADYILMKCRWVRYVTTNFRGGTDTTPVVKSFRPASMDGTVFNRVFDRALYVITSEILPDMPANKLREDVEKMAGVTGPYAAEPAPPPARAPRKPRAPKPEPEKVSVIPPADPDPLLAGTVPPAPTTPAETPVPPAPAANMETAAPARADPVNVASWKEHAKAWLDAYSEDATKTGNDVTSRWNGERSLRNRCGVTDADRQPLFEYYASILELKAAGQVARG